MKFPLLLAALALCGSAFAQTTPPKSVPKPAPKPALVPDPVAEPVLDPADANNPEKIVARFFVHLQRREVEQAYEQITKGTKIATQPENVRMLKAKTTDLLKEYGLLLGTEQVSKKAVGERLLSFTYLSLGKEQPLRWHFYFYKPQDTWKLIDLRVDDRLNTMFGEPEDPRVRE